VRWGVRELVVVAALAVTPASAGASKSAISSDCHLKGKPLYGRVQIVEHFADLDVKIVEHFPDLKVKWVEHFADKCGLWKSVEHFPDVKIRIVEHFPDVEIKLVEHFPGLP
jgi:hypothetical protein